MLVQTRQPDHPAVVAAVTADPSRLSSSEEEVRRLLGFPPYTALALLSGDGRGRVRALAQDAEGITASGPDPTGRWLIRGADHDELCNTLADTPRPTGRLRVAVDPLRA